MSLSKNYLVKIIKIKKIIMSKFKSFLDELEGASVLELNDLVKQIEEKFGVSAAAVAAAPAAGAAAGDAGEEKSLFNLELTDAGAQKIAVIKAVKAKGFMPADDNEADALALLDFIISNQPREE